MTLSASLRADQQPRTKPASACSNGRAHPLDFPSVRPCAASPIACSMPVRSSAPVALRCRWRRSETAPARAAGPSGRRTPRSETCAAVIHEPVPHDVNIDGKLVFTAVRTSCCRCGIVGCDLRRHAAHRLDPSIAVTSSSSIAVAGDGGCRPGGAPARQTPVGLAAAPEDLRASANQRNPQNRRRAPLRRFVSTRGRRQAPVGGGSSVKSSVTGARDRSEFGSVIRFLWPTMISVSSWSDDPIRRMTPDRLTASSVRVNPTGVRSRSRHALGQQDRFVAQLLPPPARAPERRCLLHGEWR